MVYRNLRFHLSYHEKLPLHLKILINFNISLDLIILPKPILKKLNPHDRSTIN